MATATSHARPLPVISLVTHFMRLIIGVMSGVFVYVIRRRRLFSMRYLIQIFALSKTCSTFSAAFWRTNSNSNVNIFDACKKASPRVENRLEERASWSALFSHWKPMCTEKCGCVCALACVWLSTGRGLRLSVGVWQCADAALREWALPERRSRTEQVTGRSETALCVLRACERDKHKQNGCYH